MRAGRRRGRSTPGSGPPRPWTGCWPAPKPSDVRQAAPGRAAAARAAGRGQPARGVAGVRRRRGPHPPRPREVPDADRRGDAAAPAPAAGQDRDPRRAARSRYIEATPADIELADRLATRCWPGRWTSCRPAPAGSSTPSPATSRPGAWPRAWTRIWCGSPAGQLREALSFGDTQLKVHLARLADYELVIVRRTGVGRVLLRAGLAAWPRRPGRRCGYGS